MADILKGRGVGRRKRKAAGGMYVRPGSQMGVGGALLTLGKNIAQGKKLGSGALKGVLRAGVTPGSGVSAGLGLAGALAGKSNNPALQKIGKGLGAAGNVAGMFTGGGGGGGLGKLAKGAMGALAGGGGGAGGGLGALAKGALGALGGGGAAAGGGGGGALAGLAKGALGALIADKGMKVSYEDGGKMSYGHGGSMMGQRKPMLIIKMDEGGVTGDPIKDGEDEDVRMIGGTEILGGDPISGDLLGVRMPSETTQQIAGLAPVGYGEMYSDPEGSPFDDFEEIPEDDTPSTGMTLIKRRQPRLIEQDIDKELQGDVKEILEGDPVDPPNNMRLVVDPSGFNQGIYKNYTKTMGVKMINPETGKEEYYYAPSARGTKSRGGEDDFKTFDDLPEELRDQAMRMFEDSEKDFLKQSDSYAKRRGFQKISASFNYGGKVM